MTRHGRPMDNPPLPRHPALQPLSREHFGGLVLARDLLRAVAADSSVEQRRAVLHRFVAAWADELEPHFVDEERLLGPLIKSPEDHRRLISEHRTIEGLAGEAASWTADHAPEPAWLGRLGQLLHDHIRWEERVLFPVIEATMSEDDARHIAHHTAAAEAQRPGARRRCDLDRGPADPGARTP